MRFKKFSLSYATWKYFERIATAISILINVILGGRVNQTLSARNYHLKKNGLPNWCWLIDKIFFWQPNHCRTSYIWWASGLEGQMSLREERNEKSCDKKEEHLKNITKLL